MKKIKIDGQEYELDKLSDNAKAQLQCIQYVDSELVRLGMQTAVLKTARAGYMKALNQGLQTNSVAVDPLEKMLKGDTFKHV